MPTGQPTGHQPGGHLPGGHLPSGGSISSAANIGGSASGGLTRSQVIHGGKTITIGLTGDTWVASGGTFDAIRQDIIDGLDSAQSESGGWNATVRDTLAVTTVVRTSDTIVTITLPAIPAYDVSERETITVTVPATAVSSSTEITATPTLLVTLGNKGGRISSFREVVEVGGQYFDVTNVRGIAAARASLAEFKAQQRAELAEQERINRLVNRLAPNVRERLNL